ncbi:MAG: T9SS type A sorting domain-containing protein, partial [Endomicrobium sp.]|nr:T9SS type A sorting domain-containing protein [Endomicrobium sp.]
SSIIGVNGGTATLYQGDQHYGNTSVSVSSGVLSDSATITITQLPKGAQIASSNIFVASQDIKKHYKIEFDNPDSYDKTYTVTLFAGDKEDYEIVYRNSEAGLWRKLDKYKNTDGTYSVLWTKDKYGALSRVNYFAVAAVNAARDVNSSVRPSIRAFMPGATVTFNNLKDGDTIAIYNLKGKLVKKITQIKPDGTAQWDGRNDSGNYVESGSYIYQVKADGKIISGSLAFVR